MASSGGHWIQLLRLRPAFEGCDVIYAIVDPSSKSQVAENELLLFPDANKDTKVALLKSAARVLRSLMRVRPDVIVTTGAAPGFLAIATGRCFGAKGVFVDSIANAHELSISAKLVLKIGGRVFTQWPDVAKDTDAEFFGAVL